LQGITDTNYVAENINTVDRFNYAQKREELAERMEEWREKVVIFKERKDEIEIEKYKRNVFLLHKWEILREKVSEITPYIDIAHVI